MSACNVGLHHKCDGQACGCTCNHIGVPAPVPATNHVALQDANERASDAIAEYAQKELGKRLTKWLS